MHLTKPERETVITLNDQDGHMTVWTAQRPWIRKLKANPHATLIEEGMCGSSPYAYFHVPAGLLTIRASRRSVSAEAKAAAAERMRRYHETKAA